MQTVYCVQGFIKSGKRSVAVAPRQYAKEVEALASGQAMAHRMEGVVIFRIEGEPEVDFWNEPVEIARHGEVPLLS